jgi:hypothetical protein
MVPHLTVTPRAKPLLGGGWALNIGFIRRAMRHPADPRIAGRQISGAC